MTNNKRRKDLWKNRKIGIYENYGIENGGNSKLEEKKQYRKSKKDIERTFKLFQREVREYALAITNLVINCAELRGKYERKAKKRELMKVE